LGNGVLREADARRIEDAARAEIDDAVQFALASPFPSPEEATNYVYA
jgi:TPP-dependent pyruvate/acetoin dehydrogenase alpha subunit